MALTFSVTVKKRMTVIVKLMRTVVVTRTLTVVVILSATRIETFYGVHTVYTDNPKTINTLPFCTAHKSFALTLSRRLTPSLLYSVQS